MLKRWQKLTYILIAQKSPVRFFKGSFPFFIDSDTYDRKF